MCPLNNIVNQAVTLSNSDSEHDKKKVMYQEGVAEALWECIYTYHSHFRLSKPTRYKKTLCSLLSMGLNIVDINCKYYYIIALVHVYYCCIELNWIC